MIAMISVAGGFHPFRDGRLRRNRPTERRPGEFLQALVRKSWFSIGKMIEWSSFIHELWLKNLDLCTNCWLRKGRTRRATTTRRDWTVISSTRLAGRLELHRTTYTPVREEKSSVHFSLLFSCHFGWFVLICWSNLAQAPGTCCQITSFLSWCRRLRISKCAGQNSTPFRTNWSTFPCWRTPTTWTHRYSPHKITGVWTWIPTKWFMVFYSTMMCLQTVAIFHDVVVVSANNEMFCHVPAPGNMYI